MLVSYEAGLGRPVLTGLGIGPLAHSEQPQTEPPEPVEEEEELLLEEALLEDTVEEAPLEDALDEAPLEDALLDDALLEDALDEALLEDALLDEALVEEATEELLLDAPPDALLEVVPEELLLELPEALLSDEVPEAVLLVEVDGAPPDAALMLVESVLVEPLMVPVPPFPTDAFAPPPPAEEPAVSFEPHAPPRAVPRTAKQAI